jgi:hypothetical protein
MKCVQGHYATVSARALNLSFGGTRHEPHVAEQCLSSLLRQSSVNVVLGARLSGVERQQAGARSIITAVDAVVTGAAGSSSSGGGARAQRFHAGVVIDATYEGDLLALTGAAWVSLHRTSVIACAIIVVVVAE